MTGKLGRRPSDPVRLARMIPLQLTGILPAYPPTTDHLSIVPRWMLGANDEFGTCGPTSIANFVVLTWKQCLGEDITVSDEAVFDLYRRSGNPNFDPNTGADDNGVDMTVLLDALLKGGINITHADGRVENVKPICYARVDTDNATQHAVTAIMGAVIWGVDLQVSQQSQMIWDYVPSKNWGGHAIMGGSYTSQSGKGQRDETVISWQDPYGTTDAFVDYQLSESYIPIFQPLWDNPIFQAGVDQEVLATDYEAITGRPFPVPVPQPPEPPQPGPGGGCLPVVAAVLLGILLWVGVLHGQVDTFQLRSKGILPILPGSTVVLQGPGGLEYSFHDSADVVVVSRGNRAIGTVHETCPVGAVDQCATPSDPPIFQNGDLKVIFMARRRTPTNGGIVTFLGLTYVPVTVKQS